MGFGTKLKIQGKKKKEIRGTVCDYRINYRRKTQIKSAPSLNAPRFRGEKRKGFGALHLSVLLPTLLNPRPYSPSNY